MAVSESSSIRETAHGFARDQSDVYPFVFHAFAAQHFQQLLGCQGTPFPLRIIDGREPGADVFRKLDVVKSDDVDVAAIGLNMLIFLAAIKGIPKSYYEAAELDGAGTWKQIRYITVPLLRFAIFFVSVTTLIGWLQFFEEPFVMTDGGPLEGTMSVALFVYKNGFQIQ